METSARTTDTVVPLVAHLAADGDPHPMHDTVATDVTAPLPLTLVTEVVVVDTDLLPTDGDLLPTDMVLHLIDTVPLPTVMVHLLTATAHLLLREAVTVHLRLEATTTTRHLETAAPVLLMLPTTGGDVQALLDATVDVT